jgi:hypothetical protein
MDDQFGTPVGPGPGPSRASASNAVSIPAILLMVLSALTVLYALVNLMSPGISEQIEEGLRNTPNVTPQVEEIVRMAGRPAVRLVVVLPWLLINGLVFFGALKMKNLRSYGLAMTSAVLALIPCCGPCGCLGIPVGIWALVVLNKPEVKDSFT